MKKFLLRIGFAITLFSLLIVGMYFILHDRSMKTSPFKDNDYVFVWGDSQLYEGLDVTMLSNKLEKQVLSSACHGSGVYDFLVSEKMVPDSLVCILAFPECTLLRNPLSDYNRIGFEAECLFELWLSGCPINECIRIYNLNKESIRNKSDSYYKSYHELYPFADSLIYPEPLPLWHSMFEEKRDWFSWKAKAYTKGIQHLSDKQSQIILIQFPFNEQIESFAQISINRHLTDSLKFELIDKYTMKYDTIILHSDSLLMYDLSHMNEVGARLATNRIAEVMKADTINNHFIVITHY